MRKEQNINIVSTGIYHPKNKVHNRYFIEHFNNKGIEVEGLLNHLQREYRYLSDNPDETVITMGYEAAKKALEEAQIEIEDIDLLIFATDTPEYTSPSNAVKVLHLLGGEGVKIQMAYDTNTNCLGMITAIDQASRILITNNRFKRALIIGGILFSSVGSENDVVSYVNFGDAAAAIVLEKREEDEKRGFIDSMHLAQTSESDYILMPKVGYAKVIRDGVDNMDDKKWSWKAFNGDFISNIWVDLIKQVTTENGINTRELGHLIFSQFTLPDTLLALNKLEIDESRTTYIGNQFGYTGTTSPIIALHFALADGKIKKGDYITLTSMGSGSLVSTLLFRM
jgi:3-oxoacyl-[acyl-carrier-protein] synthase-3